MKRLTDPIDYTPIPKEYVFFREGGKQDVVNFIEPYLKVDGFKNLYFETN